MARSGGMALLGRAAIAIAVAVAVAVGSGCSGDDEEGSSDGTAVIEHTKATATVAGRIEDGLERGSSALVGDVFVSVNDIKRTVVVAPDHSFVVRQIPSGDLNLTMEIAGIRGFITLTDVEAAELIEVVVTLASDSLVIGIRRRTLASGLPREVNARTGDTLFIDATNVSYFLMPGVFARDVVVRGNQVTLFGAPGCYQGQRSELVGALRIEGNNALVQDVVLHGSVIVTGNDARIQDTCSQCFADACLNPASPTDR